MAVPSVGTRGLVNMGASCYINSTLQVLARCENLVKMMEEVHTEGSSKACVLALRETFRHMKLHPRSVPYLPVHFRNYLTCTTSLFPSHVQADPMELLDFLIEVLNVDEFYHLEVLKITCSKSCEFYGSINSTFYKPPSAGLKIALPNNNKNSLSVLIAQYMSEKTGTICKGCGCENLTKRRLLKPPQTLLVQLLRNATTDENITKSSVEVSVNWTLQFEISDNKTVQYQLLGVIEHVGSSTRTGHYVAKVFDEDELICYSDDKVTKQPICPNNVYLIFYKKVSLDKKLQETTSAEPSEDDTSDSSEQCSEMEDDSEQDVNKEIQTSENGNNNDDYSDDNLQCVKNNTFEDNSIETYQEDDPVNLRCNTKDDSSLEELSDIEMSSLSSNKTALKVRTNSQKMTAKNDGIYIGYIQSGCTHPLHSYRQKSRFFKQIITDKYVCKYFDIFGIKVEPTISEFSATRWETEAPVAFIPRTLYCNQQQKLEFIFNVCKKRLITRAKTKLFCSDTCSEEFISRSFAYHFCLNDMAPILGLRTPENSKKSVMQTLADIKEKAEKSHSVCQEIVGKPMEAVESSSALKISLTCASTSPTTFEQVLLRLQDTKHETEQVEVLDVTQIEEDKIIMEYSSILRETKTNSLSLLQSIKSMENELQDDLWNLHENVPETSTELDKVRSCVNKMQKTNWEAGNKITALKQRYEMILKWLAEKEKTFQRAKETDTLKQNESGHSSKTGEKISTRISDLEQQLKECNEKNGELQMEISGFQESQQSSTCLLSSQNEILSKMQETTACLQMENDELRAQVLQNRDRIDKLETSEQSMLNKIGALEDVLNETKLWLKETLQAKASEWETMKQDFQRAKQAKKSEQQIQNEDFEILKQVVEAECDTVKNDKNKDEPKQNLNCVSEDLLPDRPVADNKRRKTDKAENDGVQDNSSFATTSKAKPYACSKCGKPFAHRSSMYRHRASHFKDKK